MVVDTQSTITMHRKVANSGLTVNNPIENPRSQLTWVAEYDIRIRPPAAKDGSGNRAVEVAISDNSSNFQIEYALCHDHGKMATPMVVSESRNRFTEGFHP